MDEEADSWKVESGSLGDELCKSDCKRGHVSFASVGVEEVCFQGTWTWLMTAVRGRGAGGWWIDGGSALRKAARQTVWKDTPYKEMKGRCVFFHPLWAETSCLSLTSAQLDSPVLRWFWTPGQATAELGLSGLYFKESNQNKTRLCHCYNDQSGIKLP